MFLRLSFELFTSPVFLGSFSIYSMFSMSEWFFMVSISLFKCTFAVSVVFFSVIVSKIWCKFCFVYHVGNLALIGKGTIKFNYTIPIYFLCFLYRDYFFIMYIDDWSGVWLIRCLPCSYNLFSLYFCLIFYDIYGLGNVSELKEGNIYQCCWRRSLKKTGWTRCFFCDFWTIYFCFHFRYLVVCIKVCSYTQIDLRYFDSV